MSNFVNVVVTCAKQKTIEPMASCCLRNVGRGTVANRFSRWRSRLEKYKGRKTKVIDLYAGDHWASVRKFKSKNFAVQIWVVSAGYGLLSLNDLVVPYAATFSNPNEDSVFNKIPKAEHKQASSLWWQQLNDWNLGCHPRSLSDLAKHYSCQPMILVSSERYLAALQNDILRAATLFKDRNLLSILSAGCNSLSGLTDRLLPCDARLQPLVGGARRSLNTRLAGNLISASKSLPTHSSLATRLQKMLRKAPPLQTHNRIPMQDEDVKSYIFAELTSDPSQAHTPLLRKLRDNGCACEQKRFRNLYTEIKEKIT